MKFIHELYLLIHGINCSEEYAVTFIKKLIFYLLRELVQLKSDKDYEKQIAELTYELEKYKKAIIDAGFDYYDFNLNTGEAEQSFIIGEKLGRQPDEYDTMEKRAAQFHPEDRRKVSESMGRIANGEIHEFNLQSRIFRKDGSILWLQSSGTLSHNPVNNEKHLVGIMRDITQEKANIDSLKYLADYDGMTNSYNRRSGLVKLEMDVKVNETVTIIYIDIDEFKYINDNYGHSVGDQGLKSLCKKIYEFMPKESYLIRMGGDEFLCVILNEFINDKEEIIANIMRDPIMYGNQLEDKLCFSYGIATFDQYKYDNVDEFIRDADEKMYIMKKIRKI